MSENLISIQFGYKDQAWFDANPSLLLKEGQMVHLEQTNLYKLGDGVTLLSALNFLGTPSIIDASSKFYAYYNFS